MPIPQRICEYCNKCSTSPCETKKQSEGCSRNGKTKPIVIQVSEVHKKKTTENNGKI